MPGTRPGMTWRVGRTNFGIVIFSIQLLSHAGALPPAHPGGLSFHNVGFVPYAPHTEGSGAPKVAAAERRGRWLALRQMPSLQREGTADP